MFIAWAFAEGDRRFLWFPTLKHLAPPERKATAIQLCVLCIVDFTHSTFTKFGKDAVMRERRIGGEVFAH
jgi:hypothetical protein